MNDRFGETLLLSSRVIASSLQATEFGDHNHAAVASGGFWREADIRHSNANVGLRRASGHGFSSIVCAPMVAAI